MIIPNSLEELAGYVETGKECIFLYCRLVRRLPFYQTANA